MIGKLKDLTFNSDGTQNITITVGANFRETFDMLKDKKVNIEIKKASDRRTRNQNAFAWKLIDEIAAAKHEKISTIYRDSLKDVGGISTYVGMKDEAIPVFRESWEKDHLGRQIEIVPGSERPGWSNVKIIFGSSEFDTEQMSRLISNLIQDAESLGIATISDEEAKKLFAK